MDKRSLIAVVVTFLVLILWQALYLGPKQREARERRAGRDTLVESVEDIGTESPEGEGYAENSKEERYSEGGASGVSSQDVSAEENIASLLVPEDAGGEEPDVRVKITTEKMVVVLGSVGGEIKNVSLLEHRTDNDEPVELIPPERSGGVALELIDDGRSESFSPKRFGVWIDGVKANADREIELSPEKEAAEVVFRMLTAGGGSVEKSFLFLRDGYKYDFTMRMKREGALLSADMYRVSWNCGLAVTESDEDVDRRGFASLGMVGEEFYKEDLRKFDEGEPKDEQGMVIWAGAKTKYFLSALVEDNPKAGRLLMLGNEKNGDIGFAVEHGFRGEPKELEVHFTGYIGPLDMDRLEEFGVGLEDSVELGFLRFFSVIILRIMVFLKKFIPNYGLIIILLSVLTKILFYRLTHKSFKSMKDMQRLQPRIKELQEKYKDDKERLNKETMKLYKEAGVNPLGGCLPLLFQMPVFIALFNVLRNTIELRNAPFLLWIKDLSSPDTLFGFGFSIPLLGSEFHLLPLVMGGAMVLQSKLGGSATGEAAPGQTKMMSTMMPIVFTFFFYNMPSGLVLYWIVNNLLTILQQYYAHKQIEKEDRGVTPAGRTAEGNE